MSEAIKGSTASETIQLPFPNPLIFHSQFAKKDAKTVIIRGDDSLQLCFYYRLARLAEISSFFGDLPPPSSTDLVEGLPLIPLHNTSSAAIFIALSAIDSLLQFEAFKLPATDKQVKLDIQAYIEAVLFGKQWDVPMLYRLVDEGITIRAGASQFFTFFVWAITGIEHKVVTAATATIDFDLTRIPKHLGDALRVHTSTPWAKLQDLHLRRALGPSKFRSHFPIYDDPDAHCDECGANVWEVFVEIRDRYQAAVIIQDITMMDYGVECRDCSSEMDRMLVEEGTWDWLRGFSRDYNYEAGEGSDLYL